MLRLELDTIFSRQNVLRVTSQVLRFLKGALSQALALADAEPATIPALARADVSALRVEPGVTAETNRRFSRVLLFVSLGGLEGPDLRLVAEALEKAYDNKAAGDASFAAVAICLCLRDGSMRGWMHVSVCLWTSRETDRPVCTSAYALNASACGSIVQSIGRSAYSHGSLRPRGVFIAYLTRTETGGRTDTPHREARPDERKRFPVTCAPAPSRRRGSNPAAVRRSYQRSRSRARA